MTINDKGLTRRVYMFKNHVVKVPKLTTLKFFVHGLASNVKEYRTYKMTEDKHLLAPTVFGFLGLFNVQVRCEPITDKWYKCDSAILDRIHEVSVKLICVDLKIENFGKLNGNVVCLDYAW